MTQALTAMGVEEFASALAAKQAVPGGGGAAALAGALGVALCSMAGNFTVGKKAYANVQDRLERVLGEAEGVRARLIALVDEDARAFSAVSAAWRIPKEDPARAAAVEEATLHACEAPLEMMRQCSRALQLLEEMERVGSHLLLSDVACGALLCASALEAASINVFVNTTTLSDRERAGAIEAEADELLHTWLPRTRALAARVSARVREVVV